MAFIEVNQYMNDWGYVGGFWKPYSYIWKIEKCTINSDLIKILKEIDPYSEQYDDSTWHKYGTPPPKALTRITWKDDKGILCLESIEEIERLIENIKNMNID